MLHLSKNVFSSRWKVNILNGNEHCSTLLQLQLVMGILRLHHLAPGPQKKNLHFQDYKFSDILLTLLLAN